MICSLWLLRAFSFGTLLYDLLAFEKLQLIRKEKKRYQILQYYALKNFYSHKIFQKLKKNIKFKFEIFPKNCRKYYEEKISTESEKNKCPLGPIAAC